MTEPRPGVDPATSRQMLIGRIHRLEHALGEAEITEDRLRADLADARRVNAEAWRRIETAREIAVRHHADSFPALRGGRWRWEQVITALSGTDDAALSAGDTDPTGGSGE